MDSGVWHNTSWTFLSQLLGQVLYNVHVCHKLAQQPTTLKALQCTLQRFSFFPLLSSLAKAQLNHSTTWVVSTRWISQNTWDSPFVLSFARAIHQHHAIMQVFLPLPNFPNVLIRDSLAWCLSVFGCVRNPDFVSYTLSQTVAPTHCV